MQIMWFSNVKAKQVTCIMFLLVIKDNTKKTADKRKSIIFNLLCQKLVVIEKILLAECLQSCWR